MSLIHGKSKEGALVSGTNPVLVGGVNGDDEAAFLVVDAAGRLRVATDLEVSSVTATDVTIRDAEETDQKLVVNADGSVNVQTGALNALVGEVGDDPTPKTLMARIKAIGDVLGDIITGAEIARVKLDAGSVGDIAGGKTIEDLWDKLNGIVDGTAPALALVVGTRVAEVQTEADATENILTFEENIIAVEIWHDEIERQEFIVNGIDITVPAGGWRSLIGRTSGNTVGIPAGIACIVTRLV